MRVHTPDYFYGSKSDREGIGAQMAKKIEKRVLDKKCQHLKSVDKELILEREVSTPATEVSAPKINSQRLEFGKMKC